MEGDIFGCVVVAAIGVAVIMGSITIASAGFLSLVFGALVASFIVSTIISVGSTYLLTLIMTNIDDTSKVVFLRGALAALSQPTISGICILGIIILLSYASYVITSFAEEIAILISSHKYALKSADDKKDK